jgi:hypothetical protein
MGRGKDCRGVLISHEYAANIDDEFDLKMTELLLKERFDENCTL